MRRDEFFKQFDVGTRNKLRAILSSKDGNALSNIAKLSSKFGKAQADALEKILASTAITKAAKKSNNFPKIAPFNDFFETNLERNLVSTMEFLENIAAENIKRLKFLSEDLSEVDRLYSTGNLSGCIEKIVLTIGNNGWSHALLRRIILIREKLGAEELDTRIESLLFKAGLKGIIVTSLISAYAKDQSILTAKRSVLNIPDRGTINRYTRILAKIGVQPFASSILEFEEYLKESMKCSLLDAIIIVKFNRHYINLDNYPKIQVLCADLGSDAIFDNLAGTYDASLSEGEYSFFKQSSAWLEYDSVREYRNLIDSYYDSSKEQEVPRAHELDLMLENWIGDISLKEIIADKQFTKHNYARLAELEVNGNVTRSSLFNYWLTKNEGEIGFEKDDLFTLMGLTRELARTTPIRPLRTAAKYANDQLVKLIFLLILAKRSKNELDNFTLRKLLEDITFSFHKGSLVELVKHYEVSHRYVAVFIYEICTEDFLAKLNRIAPHRADIPEIRASLHEWMAGFTGDEHYLLRARAVRIDHQINRVRNEIDDHRIYVDPSRFASWIEDEMMMELGSALSSVGSGKKSTVITCDETIISMVMTQSYTAFCSNAVFGIASYIGRRIRHGTFHGQVYSSVVNAIEKSEKFSALFNNANFNAKWYSWKDLYNDAIEGIISERLHVFSKSKPHGLLTPEQYTPAKQDILAAAVANISSTYIETASTEEVCASIIDYCWRLAELDLGPVIRYLKAQQTPLKNLKFLDEELLPAAMLVNARVADAFRRDLEMAIDRKMSMMLGWFKRPSIVAPKASVSLLFAATVAEVKDTVPEFDPQDADDSPQEIELVGNFYHLIYDSLAIVVSNAAKYADRNQPVRRKFEILPGLKKQLVIEISSYIKCSDNPLEVSKNIESRKNASYQDANLYDRKSGISKLLLLASNRADFKLDQYAVIGNQVKARLIYALEH